MYIHTYIIMFTPIIQVYQTVLCACDNNSRPNDEQKNPCGCDSDDKSERNDLRPVYITAAWFWIVCTMIKNKTRSVETLSETTIIRSNH